MCSSNNNNNENKVNILNWRQFMLRMGFQNKRQKIMFGI